MTDIFSTAHNIYTISGSTATITGSGGYRSAYGSFAIHSNKKGKYQWNVAIHKRGSSAFIGIASKKDINADYNIIDYGYQGDGPHKRNFGQYIKYGECWNKGDTVSMTVDCHKKEISFAVNGKDQGVAYNNINIGP
eukprot:187579_1